MKGDTKSLDNGSYNGIILETFILTGAGVFVIRGCVFCWPRFPWRSGASKPAGSVGRCTPICFCLTLNNVWGSGKLIIIK